MIFRPPLPLRFIRVLLPLGVALLSGCGRSPSDSVSTSVRDSVAALGRIVPGRAVIDVGAPVGERLASQTATEGLKVAQGQILATLATYLPREVELSGARAELIGIESNLDADSALARADIVRAEQARDLSLVRLEHARRELDRVRKTGNASTVRESDEQAFLVSAGEKEVALAEAALEVARCALARTLASVARESAAARVKTLEAQMELSVIRAPIAGTVLKVFAYPGELTGSGPVFQIGATDDMQTIAEVQVEDVGLVRVGQRATITSPALGEPAGGVVTEVGELIYKNDVLNLDPRAPRDTRVVEVRIRMDDSPRLAKLTNLEVDARIRLRPASAAP